MENIKSPMLGNRDKIKEIKNILPLQINRCILPIINGNFHFKLELGGHFKYPLVFKQVFHLK